MTELVIVRHGESTANRDNTYTGWSDVPLTAIGIQQAHHAGNGFEKQDYNLVQCTRQSSSVPSSPRILF